MLQANRPLIPSPPLRHLCALAIIALTLALANGTRAQDSHPGWPGKGQLFVGTCYQPVDRSPAEIKSDIALMKAAGFKMVRIGDLSWDAIEPQEGVFDFKLFDSVMDQMNAAGIKVLFDISGLPAPIWLHHKYPSVNVVDQNGITLRPAERYMDDIGDPIYREHVKRMAEQVIRHYAHHPALIAFGYDNEIGNGFMSYSPADRLRFIAWLKDKYGTIDQLNEAWATQRWSRHLNSFDEVDLPYGDGPGPPERYLDLHRYWSDETLATLEELDAIRQKYAPDIPTASNLWDTSPRKGFDYYKGYKKIVTYGAEGFYPNFSADAALPTIVGSLLTKGDLDTPTWFNEFITGSGGVYGGPRGSLRMWAYFGLLNYSQTYLAWTFNTHRGGEEQALFGLLDHDGTPSWKYTEFKQIATDFAQLEKLGFPRFHKPDVAIAYSFDSRIASHPPSISDTARDYFSVSYADQITHALEPFFNDNIDVALINIAYDPLHYKLLIIPADYVMDEKSAAAIRDYVHAGGTAIMTAFSAKVDEHSQWFNTPLPGRLSDVFGLRTSQFYRPSTPPELSFEGKTLRASISFYEVLEPSTAKTIASFTNLGESLPAITDNAYGRGHAIYLATPAQPSILGPLVESMDQRLGIDRGPVTPAGVYARVVEGRTLYVNTTSDPKSIAISGEKKGLVTGRSYQNELTLPPYQVDLLQ
jgi:beta-galactosidase